MAPWSCRPRGTPWTQSLTRGAITSEQPQVWCLRSHGGATVPENAVRVQGLTQRRCRHPMTGTIQPYNCRCTNGTSECNNGQRFVGVVLPRLGAGTLFSYLNDHSWLQLLLVLAGLYGGVSELRQQRHTHSRVGPLPRSAEVEHYQALAKVSYR